MGLFYLPLLLVFIILYQHDRFLNAFCFLINHFINSINCVEFFKKFYTVYISANTDSFLFHLDVFYLFSTLIASVIIPMLFQIIVMEVDILDLFLIFKRSFHYFTIEYIVNLEVTTYTFCQAKIVSF